METGRQRNLQTKMKGCINQDNKLTDLYLPRKCDFTDRLITPKDNSSVNADGTINLGKSSVVTICGYVRSLGQSDSAIEKVLKEKNIA